MIHAYLGPMIIFRNKPLTKKKIKACTKEGCSNSLGENEVGEKHKFCFECGSKINKKAFEVRHDIKHFGLNEIDYRFEYLDRYLFAPENFSKVLHFDDSSNNIIENINSFYKELEKVISDEQIINKRIISNFKDYTKEINKVLNNFELVEYILLPNKNLISQATYNYFEDNNKVNIPDLQFIKKDLKLFENNIYFQDYKKALKRHFNSKEVEIVYGFVLYDSIQN